MDIRESVHRFISDNFYVDKAIAITDDGSLLQRGIVDSTGMLEVIAFLEEKFDIKVEDPEVTPENLDSIARIAAFVTRKTCALGAA